MKAGRIEAAAGNYESGLSLDDILGDRVRDEAA